MLRRIRAGCTLGAVLAGAACSDATAPEGGAGGAAGPTVYGLQVILRHIDILGSCDVDILNNPSDGEFQFEIEVHDVDRLRAIYASDGYNDPLGDVYRRSPGQRINWTDRIYHFSDLTENSAVKLELSGVEWDGVLKDRRMEDRGSGDVTVPFFPGRRSRSITIGANGDCRMSLIYDAIWTESGNPV
jgi:hypothetical protein